MKKQIVTISIQLKMQYNHHPIDKLITELIVILWVFSKICSIVGHDIDKHHKNHICDHHHPKAHNVCILRYIKCSFSIIYSILANWTHMLLLFALNWLENRFEMRKCSAFVVMNKIGSVVSACYICFDYAYTHKK